MDYGIFISPDDTAIDKAIKQLRELGYDLEDKGDIANYLGINFE